jgi:DNA-binding transcriptional ArsR family regulator
MVEYSLQLDLIFSSLSDPTRRDILKRVSKKELSISDIAKHYALTFAAISKHLKILEKANLISKRRQGKEQIVALSPAALKNADEYLRSYEAIWNGRLDRLDTYLKTIK